MGARALGDFLVKQGLLTADGLRRGLEAQKSLECRLGTVLLDLGLLSEEALLRGLGRYCSARTVHGRELTAVPSEVIAMVPARFALRHLVVPFRLSGKTLSVATIDPRDLLMEDELSLMTGCMISSFVALEVRIEEALARYHGKQLPVQIVSLLKRLRADDGGNGGARQGAPAPAVGTDPARSAAAHRTAVEPRVSSRSGLKVPRKPDDTAVVVLSEDELADFPSLRPSMEDSGSGTVDPAALAAVAAATPGSAEPGGAVAAVEASDEPPPSEKAETESEASTQPVPGDSVDERLEVAARRLLEAEMREDIADALFLFCSNYLRRRLLLAVREGTIMGWRGEGEGIDQLWVRSISIPVSEETVFQQLSKGGEMWLGPLPRMAGHQDLLLGLGGREPPACVVLPLLARTRVIAYLYGDNLEDDLEDLPVEALRRLAAKTGLALEVTMLKNKILTL